MVSQCDPSIYSLASGSLLVDGQPFCGIAVAILTTETLGGCQGLDHGLELTK